MFGDNKNSLFDNNNKTLFGKNNNIFGDNENNLFDNSLFPNKKASKEDINFSDINKKTLFENN